ncbi:MAG TPA: protoporphyrinogen oxidase HemJ [Alphaproteobacteria bacterium]|nr:protoporphyrinogen oxidase HemJ [Alphaproteobacteria bacterium]
MDTLIELYLWIKALHVISVIAWMAGLLYLPRLFVYHAAASPGSEQSETFKVMERRLLRAIMNPAMGATYVFGALLLISSPNVDWAAGWLWIKLAMITVLTVLHHLYGLWRKAFERDENTRRPRFYKLMNEAPTAAMVVLVLMAVAKPF